MKKASTILFVSLSFLLPLTASAQWTSSGHLVAGVDTVFQPKLIKSFGSSVYVCADKGLFESTDNGETWKNLTWAKTNTAGHPIVTVYRNSQGKLYAADDSLVFTSTDGGSSWSTSSLSPMKGIADITQAPNGNLLISYAKDFSSGGVYYGQDDLAGVHASNVSGNASVRYFLTVGSSVFAGSKDGALVSTDNGMTWSIAGTGWPSSGGGGFNVLAKQGSTLYAGSWGGAGLYVSTDNGATWTNPDTALFKSFCQVFSLAAGTDTVLASMDGGCNGGNPLKATGDDGKTWTPFMSGISASFYPVVGVNSAGTCFFTFNRNNGEMYKLCTSTSGIESSTRGSLSAKIHPNPVSSQLTLKLGAPVQNAEVRITSLTGQTLHKWSSQDGQVIPLNVSDLKPGLYLMHVASMEGSVVLKFQKY